jgi:hypothetical protein
VVSLCACEVLQKRLFTYGTRYLVRLSHIKLIGTGIRDLSGHLNIVHKAFQAEVSDSLQPIITGIVFEKPTALALLPSVVA